MLKFMPPGVRHPPPHTKITKISNTPQARKFFPKNVFFFTLKVQIIP